jgi:type II secretion system protein G
MAGAKRGFTLVEILIVVVILGILAAIVVPTMVRATDDAAENATLTELQKLRNHLGVYFARNMTFPAVAEGEGAWGELISQSYLSAAPVNSWVGMGHGREIVFGTGPDGVYQTDYGWIYDPSSGDVWAGGFDAGDKPIDKP